MAGRNAKPIGLHLAEGNPSHLTKEEIDARTEAEIKLGAKDLAKLKKPSFVTKDRAALKLWNELIKEYKEAAEKGAKLLSSSDVGVLAIYCKTFSEYERLLAKYQQIEQIQIDSDVLSSYLEQAENTDGAGHKALLYLSQLASLEGALKIETAINKKMDMLLKMQDRLFLNPLSKVKSVPVPKKEGKKSEMGKFLGRRAGEGYGV